MYKLSQPLFYAEPPQILPYNIPRHSIKSFFQICTCKFQILQKCFCCDSLKIKIVFVVLHPDMKLNCIPILGQKKLVLFPKIGRVKIFLSLTGPHSQIYIRIYIFNFRKHKTNKQKKTRIEKSKGN